MANPEHIAVLMRGNFAVEQWRQKNPGSDLDLINASLSGVDLSGTELKSVDFRGANLSDARLVGCDFRGCNPPALLTGADLSGSNLEGANLENADLRGAKLNGTNLRGSRLVSAKFSGAKGIKADFSDSNMKGCKLDASTFRNSNFTSSDLTDTDFEGASLIECRFVRARIRNSRLSHVTLENSVLKRAELSNCDLSSASISGSDFYEVDGTGANFDAVLHAERAKNLTTIRLLGSDLKYFDSVRRSFWETYLSWENLRTVGRLPLFTASYAVLVLIPIFFYGLAVYNENVTLLMKWAELVAQNQADPLAPFATSVVSKIQTWPVPRQSLLLLISTVLLALGSTIYALFCPSRVREFSRDQWVDQLSGSLVHYWPLAWKFRLLRIAASGCYAIGGAGVLWVIASKVVKVAHFILRYSDFPWHRL